MAHDDQINEVLSNDFGTFYTSRGSIIDSKTCCIRKSGIEIIGDLVWGTHFCQFYQTQQDLIDILVPYFKAGLKSTELCIWVTSSSLSVEYAREALRASVPDIDNRIDDGQMEIIPHTNWYLSDGKFDQETVMDSWLDKLHNSIAMGYAGLRVTGDTSWLTIEDWPKFINYEEALNSVMSDKKMLALCTYSESDCGLSEITDVVANHEYTLLKRKGIWSVTESSVVRQSKLTLELAIEELNFKTRQQDDLNEEIKASADELEAMNKELRATEDELLKLNRTLGAHSKSDQLMLRSTDELEYLAAVCKIIVEDCGHAMVWIGYCENDEAKSVRPVTCSGFEEGYLETLNITWADTERGRGPTGTAIRTGKPVLCRNMLTDPKFEPWREEATKRGYAASIALPLISEGKVLGAITIYLREPDPFSEDEVKLLSGLADDLAYGIASIRLRAANVANELALRASEQRVRLKLDSILSPDGDIGDLELADILDCRAVQSLMDSFYKLVKIPMAIIDLKGKVLVGVGWQDICTKFHRVHPETCKYCIESDTMLTADVPPGEFRLYQCKNNMWDISTPLIVGGEHVGNLFSGQFFFDDEPINYELFRSQARHYGFNEEDYIKALENVLRLSRETLNDGVAFLLKLAAKLSKLSYSNIKLARSLAERDSLMNALSKSEAQIRTIVENLTEGLIVSDLDGNLVQWNRAALEIHGFTCEEDGPRGWQEFAKIFKLSTKDGELLTIDNWPLARILRGEEIHNFEVSIQRLASDSRRVFSYGGTLVRDADGEPMLAVVTVSDITEKADLDKQRDDLYRREHHISEMLQNAIIPLNVPNELYGYRIGVRYRSALSEALVGGDFYDVFDLGNSKIAVLIGDVAGKGLLAAIRVASARYAIRAYAYLWNSTPAQIMTMANDALCKEPYSATSMLTAFFAIIDTGSGSISYTCAGHEPPIVTSKDGLCKELTEGGMPIGVMSGIVYAQDTFILNSGDTVVMVTDGITEARNSDRVFFDKTGVIEYVCKNRNSSPDEIASGLLATATAHSHGQLRDDAAVLVFSKIPKAESRNEIE